MSRWVRGIYNAAANFNMSRSLRAAAGRILDRDTEHVREVGSQCNKCEQSCQSNKSDQSSQHACACHSARTCNCTNGECADNDIGDSSASSNNIITNNVYAKRNNTDHSDSCTCAICIDYRDYTASIRTEGQGAGSWIRLSDESGTFKQSNPDATGSVERVTGIPTGVTI